MSEIDKKIICKIHGESHSTFICNHLAYGSGMGFYYGNQNDIRPDAWCYECDQKLMTNDGEWNEEIEAFAKVKVICAYCYDNIRLKNEIPHKRISPQNRPTIEKDGWELASAKRLNALHPESFEIPSSSDVRKLKQGSLVKLLFAFENTDNSIGIERMWVRVVEISTSRFIGELETSPMKIDNLKPMTKIEFADKHIASIVMPNSFKRITRWLFPSKKFKRSSTKENEAYF